MPGAWPEPFGLVAIESLACGTPIVARPSGALPEIVRDGVDGFLAAGVAEMAALVERTSGLDRAAIRASVLERFSAERMTDSYEALFREVVHPSPMVDGLADRRFAPILVVSPDEALAEGPASAPRPSARPDAASGARSRR
jgi:hypothetical protein